MYRIYVSFGTALIVFILIMNELGEITTWKQTTDMENLSTSELRLNFVLRVRLKNCPMSSHRKKFITVFDVGQNSELLYQPNFRKHINFVPNSSFLASFDFQICPLAPHFSVKPIYTIVLEIRPNLVHPNSKFFRRILVDFTISFKLEFEAPLGEQKFKHQSHANVEMEITC